jgi:hypothetical protein
MGFYPVALGIHTAEPLVFEPSIFEVETVIAKFKRYKLPSNDQIPIELFHAGGEIRVLHSEIHKLTEGVREQGAEENMWTEGR